MNKRNYEGKDPHSTLAYYLKPKKPCPYDQLDELAEKYISQGYEEDEALEKAARRCDEIEADPERESLQWN